MPGVVSGLIALGNLKAASGQQLCKNCLGSAELYYNKFRNGEGLPVPRRGYNVNGTQNVQYVPADYTRNVVIEHEALDG